MIRKVIVSLGSPLSDAQEWGLATRNPVKELRAARRKGKERQADKRQKGKLKVGVDIPNGEEIKAIVATAKGRWRPLLIAAVFTGMRSSELRGLRWIDVDFERGEINVHQRADDFGEIGPPKSDAGERAIPVPPIVISALKEWKLACPRRSTGRHDANGNSVKELHYVFPNGSGNIESRSNIINAVFCRRRSMLEWWSRPTRRTMKVTSSWRPNTEACMPFAISMRRGRSIARDGGLRLPCKAVRNGLGIRRSR